MFEPNQQDQGGPAKGTRSSRRRARPSSNTDVTVQAPKAKRQRVPLHETTVANSEALPETDTEMDGVKPDQLALQDIKNENLLGARKELSVRQKKQKAGERTAKGDGSIVLVCRCMLSRGFVLRQCACGSSYRVTNSSWKLNC